MGETENSRSLEGYYALQDRIRSKLSKVADAERKVLLTDRLEYWEENFLTDEQKKFLREGDSSLDTVAEILSERRANGRGFYSCASDIRDATDDCFYVMSKLVEAGRINPDTFKTLSEEELLYSFSVFTEFGRPLRSLLYNNNTICVTGVGVTDTSYSEVGVKTWSVLIQSCYNSGKNLFVSSSTDFTFFTQIFNMRLRRHLSEMFSGCVVGCESDNTLAGFSTNFKN